MIIEKTYICPIIGTGTEEDPRRPSLADVPIVKSWFMIELGNFKGVDFCLVSIVADEVDHQKIVLDKDMLHFATRLNIELDSAKLDTLKKQFTNLLLKWEQAKTCWVLFNQKTGKEE